MKELSEKSEVLQQEEQQKKSWEIKAVASEKQIEQLQVRQAPANPLPTQRWGRGQNCLGLVDLAVERAWKEMSIHGWKAKLPCRPLNGLPPVMLSHATCSLCSITSKAQGVRCPG